ncbi:hypothetical protein MLD38_003954 [Melastoma candidum]|uniref:Uncharacterized protein n=1 Tax=Melastoma candidum TaxID=119954 RepID=A0ACB9S5Q8_9MYRT|nr:hypothetical protein MLD38_003954 [Melastoma candidum]
MDINNVTCMMPKVSLLDLHYHNITGVFRDDFPAHPRTKFNYMGTPPLNIQTERGTRLCRLAYNSTVQVSCHSSGNARNPLPRLQLLRGGELSYL